MPKPTPPKVRKNIEFQKQSVPTAKEKRKTSMKKTINGGHPIIGVKRINTWVCKNLACKAVVPSEDSFCKRCSCCICHRFDDKKDPSLWLVCASENDGNNCCGSSCHIEYLLQDKRVGCFNIEKIIHLDGSFSCAACGKISGILGLLEGTRRFKELHEIIEDAKEKLESEIGPLDGMSAKMARNIVSRSSVGIDVQKLCSIALQKADDCLSSPDLHL